MESFINRCSIVDLMRITLIPGGNWTPARDRNGVGGFIEAILAIMIVTSGLILLTFSFYLVAIDDDVDSDLDGRCEELINLVLDDVSIMIEPDVIRHSALGKIDFSKIDIENGFKLMIDEISPEFTIVLGGRGTYSEGEKCCLSVPVNVYHAPNDVRPALLIAWTW